MGNEFMKTMDDVLRTEKKQTAETSMQHRLKGVLRKAALGELSVSEQDELASRAQYYTPIMTGAQMLSGKLNSGVFDLAPFGLVVFRLNAPRALWLLSDGTAAGNKVNVVINHAGLPLYAWPAKATRKDALWVLLSRLRRRSQVPR